LPPLSSTTVELPSCVVGAGSAAGAGLDAGVVVAGVAVVVVVGGAATSVVCTTEGCASTFAAAPAGFVFG
jgi:hypothetical protein